MNTTRLIGAFCMIVLIMLNSVLGSHKVKAEDNEILLHSETAVLMDKSSGQVLYEQNMNQTMYPASITKIVTAIVAIEEGELNELVTVSERARNTIGTRVYLLENEQVPLLKLVQGLLINSGNDAGTAIAEHLAGTEKRFAKRMNEFVREKIGVEDTQFTNPHGLFDEDHVTTAYDMAKITQYAMQNDLFREIVGTKEMKWIGEGWETTIHNHNRLLWRYEGATGVKNGYVSQSGFTLVSTVLRDETELIAVTLNAPSSEQAYTDMEAMFNFGFKHYQSNVINKGYLFQAETGEVYELKDDVHFLTKKGEEEASMKVKDEGILSIKTEDHAFLLSTVLTPVERSKNVKQRTEEHIDQTLKEKKEEQTFIERWMTQLISILNLR